MLAALPLLALAALFATAFDPASLPGTEELRVTWHAMVFVGVVASGIAILAFNFGVRTLGAVTGTAFLNFVPVSALAFGVVLGKPPGASELVGAAMVVGALLIHTVASVGQLKGAVASERPRVAARLRPADCGQGQ